MAEAITIDDDMRAAIGRDSPTWRYEVTTTSVRAFARGIGYTDPVYFDEDAARARGFRSLPAPSTYLGTPVFIPGQCSDTFSRPLAGQPQVDHGLRNLLDGGTETRYFDQICAGDTLSVVSRITDLEVKHSRALGEMLVIVSETTFTNTSNGLVAAVQRSTAIAY